MHLIHWREPVDQIDVDGFGGIVVWVDRVKRSCIYTHTRTHFFLSLFTYILRKQEIGIVVLNSSWKFMVDLTNNGLWIKVAHNCTLEVTHVQLI